MAKIAGVARQEAGPTVRRVERFMTEGMTKRTGRRQPRRPAAVMHTPVEVTDDVSARLQEPFDTGQIAELNALLTVVNLNRFNAAVGVGSAGFSPQ